MGLLSGKTALIFGLANERSIAWGIAKAFHEQGAAVGFSYHPAVEKHARPLAVSLEAQFIEPCDVSSDDEIQRSAEKSSPGLWRGGYPGACSGFCRSRRVGRCILSNQPGRFPPGDGYQCLTRFTALVQHFKSLLRPGGSLLTLTYYGSEKVAPNYNVMGVAKSCFGGSVRYLAYDLGSPTCACQCHLGWTGNYPPGCRRNRFKSMYRQFSQLAPLQQNISIEDIGGTAVYLASDLSSKVTGEIIYVDSGYNILAFPVLPSE